MNFSLKTGLTSDALYRCCICFENLTSAHLYVSMIVLHNDTAESFSRTRLHAYRTCRSLSIKMGSYTDVKLWTPLIKQSLWVTFYYIFTTIQKFVWLFTGTHRKILDSRLPCNYQRSAQVCIIHMAELERTCVLKYSTTKLIFVAI